MTGNKESPLTKKRFVVLVNPHGGTRRGLAILEEVRPVFVATGAELDVQHTRRGGGAAGGAAGVRGEESRRSFPFQSRS